MEATEPKTVDEIADMMTQKQSAAEEAEAPEEAVEVEATEAEQDPDETVAEEIPESDEYEPDAEEEAVEEVSEEPSQELYTVTVDGEQREVPLDELLRGYSGQGYVQKGMKDNAEKAKSIEAQQQELQATLSAVQQFKQQVETTGFLPAPQLPDPAMEAEDPIGYISEVARYQRDSQAYNQQQQQLAYVSQMQEQQAGQQREAHLAEQRRVLVQKFPDIATPEKAKAFQARLSTGAQEYYGLGPDVLDGMTDAFAVEVLNDAVSWRELQKHKPKAQEKTQTARPLKPRNSPRTDTKTSAVEKARARAMKTGSVDDIAALLDAKG